MKTMVKILDQLWSFEKVTSNDSHLVVDGRACLGATWPVQREMYVSSELAEDRAVQTIRHELCHAYIAATQVHDVEAWDEEAVCDMVAIYGSSILKAADQVLIDLREGQIPCRGSCNET